MINPDQIPPAALEAGAALIYEADHPGQRFADASELTRRVYLELARAAFEAMVGEWPDMAHRVMPYAAIILPLPTEASDE